MAQQDHFVFGFSPNLAQSWLGHPRLASIVVQYQSSSAAIFRVLESGNILLRLWLAF